VEEPEKVQKHTHTHTEASVWIGRCHSVVESSSTHRQKSYSK
jgi:hypothetical protein